MMAERTSRPPRVAELLDLADDWTILEDPGLDLCAACTREGGIGRDLELVPVGARGSLVLCGACLEQLAASASRGGLGR